MESAASPQTSPREVYGRAHVPLPRAAAAAAADAVARDTFGVPGRVLMENAGRAAALVLQRTFPHGRIVAVAGAGNNGGDLLVLARVLHEWGRDVDVVAVGSRAPDTALLHGAELTIHHPDHLELLLAGAAVVVDGILGTGAQGAPREPLTTVIELINRSGKPVLALDLPSGADANDGGVPGACCHAHVTVCFGWPKLGLLLHPARAQCGRLIAVEIGFPAQSLAGDNAVAITPAWGAARLRVRAPDAHKGSAGRLLLLAGRSGMAGAAAIAAEAASRAGAGLVRIASDAANRTVLQTLVPEATFLDRAQLAPADVEPLHALIAGPGLGTDDDARHTLRRTIDMMPDKPVLLDADALNLFAQDTAALVAIAARQPVVITPHAGELSRLLHRPVSTITGNAPAHAREAAKRFGCTVLLKGQPSLVATAGGALFVNTVGSSDLATAGMGDQLAGVIGVLLAAGHGSVDAACLGLLLSGRAADLAALGRSLTPRDVSNHLPAVFSTPPLARSPLDLPFVTFDQPARW